MNDSAIEVTGLRESQRALYGFGQQLGDKVVYGALRQGANYVKRGVQDAAPVRTGRLRRGFRVSRSKIYNARTTGNVIGIFLSLKKGKDAPFYGRFINDGWKAGKTHVPGIHFVERTFERRKSAAVQLIVRSVDAGVQVIKRRLGLG